MIIKSFFKSIVTIVLILVLFSSCQKNIEGNWKVNVIHALKEDPSIVASVDFLKLINKSAILDSDYIPDQYKGMMAMYVQNTLNSENLGFQVEGNNHFVVALDSMGIVKYVFFMADVLDEQKMSKSLKFLIGGAKDVDDYNFLSTTQGVVFGWDKNHLIGLMKGPDINDLNFSSKKTLKKLLDSKSISSEKQDGLEDFLEREDDANAFIYLNAYSKMVASISGINYTSKGDSNFSEKIITALNFLEGKIELSADLISDEKNKIVLFKDKPLNSTFFDYLTSNGKLISFFFGNFNLDALVNNSTLRNQYADLYAELDLFLVPFDLQLTDLSNIFTGECSFSLLDIEFNSDNIENQFDPFGDQDDGFFDDVSEDEFYDYLDNYDDLKSTYSFSYLLSFSLIDSSAIMDLLNTNNPDFSKGNVYPINEEMSALVKNNVLFLSSNELILSIINQKGRLTTFPKTSEFATPAYGHIVTDTSHLPNSFKKYLENEFGNSTTEILLLFKSIEYKADNTNASFEITFENEKENSLKFLLETILQEFSKNTPFELTI